MFRKIFGIFKSQNKEKLLNIIESFSLGEKVIFYFLVFVFAGSSLFLLSKVNDYFSIEVPSDGGEIREGVIGYPRYINPIIAVTDSGKDLTTLIYSGLLRSKSDGTLENDLAKDYSISEDGLTYTFNIKDEASFQDGKPVTAEDVEFTIKKALDPVLKSPKAPNWEGVEVKVLGPKKIEFALHKAYAPFLQNLTLGVLPKHMWQNIDSEAFAFSQFNIEPIGSGPYKIKDIKRDDSGLPLYYHLVPFENYVLGKAHISDIYVYFFNNQENLLKAFQNGEVSSINSVGAEILETIKDKGQVLQAPLPRLFAVFWNQNQAGVFVNKEVRMALDEAVDRNSLIQNILGGYGTKSLSPMPPSLSVATDTDENAETRIENAKKILEKAGWSAGSDGILKKTNSKKETTTLSFSISTANSPDLKKTAEMLKATWEKIGAQVDVKIFDLADLQQNVIRPRKYDALLFGEVVGRDLDLFAFWHSSQRNDPGLNMAMYTNSKVDKLLEKARLENDQNERIEDLKEAESMILSDYPATFLYSPDFIYIVSEDLKGVDLKNVTSAPERFIGIEKWYIKTDKIWPIFK